MRTMNVIDKHYCKSCPFEDLQISDEIVSVDDMRRVISSVRCSHSELCEHLWSHLVDVYEDEDEESETSQSFESDDWSFTDDASMEDMQL